MSVLKTATESLKKDLRRRGPKYVCPYCLKEYYFKAEGEVCRDTCFAAQSGAGEGKEINQEVQNGREVTS